MKHYPAAVQRPLLILALLLITTACAPRRTAPILPPSETAPVAVTTDPAQTTIPSSIPDADITVDTTTPTGSFDPRLLGTNIPAWLHQPGQREAFSDETFLARTAGSGATMLRFPGGSWGNYYDWLGCETANAERGSADGCYWTWAARPTDFANAIKNTGLPAMWTVSFEGTAQSAAALVAFFNGDVNDSRPIGIDRNGRDWKTVGDWARFRSANGNPEPQKILLWEIGNEIYGAKQSTAGEECAPFGWEEVWTCDGDAYVRGDATHDGFVAFRQEMRRIDPEILVGAVGVTEQGEWGNWGNEVIAGAGAVMDFYVIHSYGFGESVTDVARVLAQPQAMWQEVMSDINAAFDRHAGGRRVPIAVTEYNAFAFRELDTNELMTRAVNTLFIADTIGQLAQQGFSIANQWNLANGAFTDGTTDVYAMLEGDDYRRTPQYYAFPLWSRFGAQMLPVSSRFDPSTTLSVYAGRDDDGTITLMAINKTDKPIEATLQLNGAPAVMSGAADVLQAASLGATIVTLNGVSEPSDDLSDAPGTPLTNITTPLEYAFPPYSVTLLRLSAAKP